MKNAMTHVEAEKSAAPDFYEEPAAPRPIGESTMPTELAARILRGVLVGLLGAAIGVAWLWVPISSGSMLVALCMVPQAALTVIFAVGYVVGLSCVADEPAPKSPRTWSDP